MKKAYAIYVVFVIFIIWLSGFLAFTPGFSGRPSFVAFTFHRTQKYYSQFADACDELIAKVGTGLTTNYMMDLKDPRLPIVLRNLNATSISVETNRVWIFFKISGRYSIGWEPDYVDSNAWVLTTYGDGNNVRVFLRTNLAPHSALRTPNLFELPPRQDVRVQ